jgi:hypothetical protein
MSVTQRNSDYLLTKAFLEQLGNAVFSDTFLEQAKHQ